MIILDWIIKYEPYEAWTYQIETDKKKYKNIQNAQLYMNMFDWQLLSRVIWCTSVWFDESKNVRKCVHVAFVNV